MRGQKDGERDGSGHRHGQMPKPMLATDSTSRGRCRVTGKASTSRCREEDKANACRCRITDKASTNRCRCCCPVKDKASAIRCRGQCRITDKASASRCRGQCRITDKASRGWCPIPDKASRGWCGTGTDTGTDSTGKGNRCTDNGRCTTETVTENCRRYRGRKWPRRGWHRHSGAGEPPQVPKNPKSRRGATCSKRPPKRA